MFERRLVIAGIRKQRHILENLIEELEARYGLDDKDSFLYEVMTKRVESNLKKLRKIKNDYLAFQN